MECTASPYFDIGINSEEIAGLARYQNKETGYIEPG